MIDEPRTPQPERSSGPTTGTAPRRPQNTVKKPPPPYDLRKAKIFLSAAALILGITTIIVTFANGGGIAARGVLLGAILAIMAGLRLYLTLKHRV